MYADQESLWRHYVINEQEYSVDPGESGISTTR